MIDTDNLYLLIQLITAEEDAVAKIESFQEMRNSGGYNKAKQEILNIQESIARMVEKKEET